MLACEARHLATLPREERATFYALAEKRRGVAAVAALKAEVSRQYHAAKR